MDLLGRYGQWQALLPIWEELRRDKPALALEVAAGLDRIDLIRSFRDHPDPEARAAAVRTLLERGKTADAAQFLGDHASGIREQVARGLAKAHDLKALSPVLADENAKLARIAYDALAGFSDEVKAALESFGARGKGFEDLDVSKRKEIAKSVAGWLEEKGDAVWIGKAKAFLKMAAVTSVRRNEFARQATEILVSVLPTPEAVELLVTDPHVDVNLAAAAFCQKGLVEPLKRLFADLMKVDKDDRGVTKEILDALIRCGLRDELKAYAESLACRPADDVSYHYDLFAAALVGVVELGDLPAAIQCLEKQGRISGYERNYPGVVLASAKKCPDGPAAFFDFVARHPERKSETSALVEAFEACGSAEGLKRCLRDFPAPPAREILDALLAIGEPEPVLEEALEGEFWHEAAAALHDATGDWFGYYGKEWKEPSAPQKSGFLSVLLPAAAPGATPGARTPPRAPGMRLQVAVPVDPAWRRAAVESWRAALKSKKS
jgi:hypothetical protein